MNPNDKSESTQLVLRDTRDGPWCWQSKAAMTLITERFSESGQAATARSIYVGLTELSSDEGGASFRVPKSEIAHRAGVSVKSVERVLNGLEQLGLLRIGRSLANAHSGTIKAPNDYALLSMRLCDATSMRHGGQSSKSHIERKVKNSEERKSIKGEPAELFGTEKAEKAKPRSEADVAEYCSQLGLTQSDSDYLWANWQANGFTRGGKPIKDWRAAVRSWRAASYFPSQKQQQRNGQHTRKAGPVDYSALTAENAG